MNYKIRVSGNLEFQRLVGTIASKDVRGVGHGLFSQVDAISLIYDGGKLKFLQDYDEAIDSINACVHKINYWLSSQTGLPICEGVTLNFAEISDASTNSASLIVSMGGRVSCACTLGFLIEADCTSECDKEFTRSYVREAIRQLMGNSIDLHTFDGVEVMGEPELNVTIVNK